VSDEPDTVILTYHEEGVIDRRRLSGILGASTTLLVLLLIIGLSLGAVGAAGIGIGGFVIEFSDVSAPSGSVYPAAGPQSQCDSAPQMMATLNGESEIQGYFLVQKTIPVPMSSVDGVTVDVMSEAGNNTSITAENLDLRLTALSSAELVLRGGKIKEYGPDEVPVDSPIDSYSDVDESNSTGLEDSDVEFGIDASGGLGIRRGRAVVYHIAFGNIDITSVGVSGSMSNGNATVATDYDCDELKPPARTEGGNFTLPRDDGADARRTATAGVPGEPTGGNSSNVSDVTTNGTEADTEDEVNATDGDAPEAEPSVEVVNLSPPRSESLEIGDTFSVALNVSNTGNATGDWRVYMNVTNREDNVTAGEENLVLEPGEGTDVSFRYEATSADVPTVDATLGVEEAE